MMIVFLAGLSMLVLVHSVLLAGLQTAAKRQRKAQRLAIASFAELTAALEAQAATLEAQGLVNERQLTVVKALQARLALHDEAILRLRAQDCQFMEILVAVNLVQTQTPPLTVN